MNAGARRADGPDRTRTVRHAPRRCRAAAFVAAVCTPCTLAAFAAPRAARAQAAGSRADSVPADPWVALYFADFDRAARAAGLTPLRQASLRPDALHAARAVRRAAGEGCDAR